jgi:hypothetical protein
MDEYFSIVIDQRSILMEHKRISIIVSAFLLCLLSACQMTGVTPVPQGPGAGIIQNNPGGPIQLAPTSTTPTTAPPHQGSCNQTGCPYPAICDQTSGVCTINQQQGPGAAAPQQPGAGIIANNPNPGSLLPPACSPPVPSISNINSFCANHTSKLGGATWDQNPPDGDPSVVRDATFINNFSQNPDCLATQSKMVCSGPQDEKVTFEFCTTCGAPNYQQVKTPAIGAFVCANGYVNDGTGFCAPQGHYSLCPTGTHYDNSLQNCAADVTDKLDSPCPVGFPYYLPDYHQCLAKAYPIVYNCQTFQLQLGECPVYKVPGTGGTGPCKINPMTGACQ